MQALDRSLGYVDCARGADDAGPAAVGRLPAPGSPQITDSSVRTTVLSISGQANAIGEAAGGPVLGAVGNTRRGIGSPLSDERSEKRWR